MTRPGSLAHGAQAQLATWTGRTNGQVSAESGWRVSISRKSHAWRVTVGHGGQAAQAHARARLDPTRSKATRRII